MILLSDYSSFFRVLRTLQNSKLVKATTTTYLLWEVTRGCKRHTESGGEVESPQSWAFELRMTVEIYKASIINIIFKKRLTLFDEIH